MANPFESTWCICIFVCQLYFHFMLFYDKIMHFLIHTYMMTSNYVRSCKNVIKFVWGIIKYLYLKFITKYTSNQFCNLHHHRIVAWTKHALTSQSDLKVFIFMEKACHHDKNCWFYFFCILFVASSK